MEYRFLNVGEIIGMGDEWYDDRDRTWNTVTEASAGYKIVGIEENVFRRQVANATDELTQLRAENARLTAEVEAGDKLRDEIKSWLKMLSTEIFREPDFVKARALLEAGGITIDGLSASNMRHVLTRLVEKDKQARAARLTAKE